MVSAMTVCCFSSSLAGFPLGSTVRSQTKGIWMWCLPHPTKPNHTLVLLDTEGLGDVEKVRQKIFSALDYTFTDKFIPQFNFYDTFL
jgi:hypothetical protein